MNVRHTLLLCVRVTSFECALTGEVRNAGDWRERRDAPFAEIAGAGLSLAIMFCFSKFLPRSSSPEAPNDSFIHVVEFRSCFEANVQ